MDERYHHIPDTHGHAKGEHRPYGLERPIPYSARMLFLWFYHACRRGFPRRLMLSDHTNFLTPDDPAAVAQLREAIALAAADDCAGAAQLADVDLEQAEAVRAGLLGGMQFSIGAELDNDPRSRADTHEILDAMRPDGLIRSVHFLRIEHPQDGGTFAWPFDNPEFAQLHDVLGAQTTWELYMSELLPAIETQPGHILGHFFVPGLFGHWPAPRVLAKYEDRVLEACAARGMAVEFNVRFLYRDYPPERQAVYREMHERFLTKAVAHKVGIAVGSDAHAPGDQGRAFEGILPILERAGVKELVYPVRGELIGVRI